MQFALVAAQLVEQLFAARAPLFQIGRAHGLSAVFGKTRYVTFNALTGRLFAPASAFNSLLIRSDASPMMLLGPASPTIAGYSTIL